MPIDSFVSPSYGIRSLAEVLPAALRALGVPWTAAADGALALPPTRAVVVLLVDGLGAEQVRAHARAAPFLAALPDAGPLTAGFPSSTPISLTSLGTGLPPGAHGMLGCSIRMSCGAGDPELLDTLKWTPHGLRHFDLREDYPPERVQPHPTVFERAAARGVAVTVVSKKEFAGSGLTRAALRGGVFRGTKTVDEVATAVVAAAAGPGPRLCYGYLSELDYVGHRHGPGSGPWLAQLRAFDLLVARIVEEMPGDTTVLATGDHGMVTVTRVFDADTDPVLRTGVALLGGDPRARHVYVRPGALDDVRAAWQATLTDHAWIGTAEQAIAEGWFGPVAPHLRDRIGDLVVAARGDAAVVRSVTEPYISGMPGQHGSLTAAEQLVPLLVAAR